MKTLEEFLELPKPIAGDAHRFVMTVMLAARTLAAAARDRMGRSGLTAAQFNVLMLLKHQFAGGASQVELSRRVLVNRANMTGLIDRLEKAGLVKRSRIKSDRRAYAVTITTRGIDRLAAAESAYFDGIGLVERGIPKAMRDRAAAALISLCEICSGKDETVKPQERQ